ncbi:N-glycosylase/DNA lyase [Candidatus Woesearchaeota archaeon]|nr:N-glycosylase/DNA lyase [Candidatus Woesearchaeota archaeon]
MRNLISEINALKDSSVGRSVNKRLSDFSSFQKRPAQDWFSELCFCLLTSNSKAKTAWNIQKELDYDGFMALTHEQLSRRIRANKHRFHNTKASFIIEARKHPGIKDVITPIVESSGGSAAREWLVENIKGLGYKEASHFLRNVGYFGLAILDRHINSIMLENGLIKEIPKSLGRKQYLEVEKKFKALADKVDMAPGELDMYMWYMKAGEVLK